jgi:ferrous iron transport protein A
VTVKDLVIGQSALVNALSDDALGRHLVEMGVVPGEFITVERIAPLGDPIAVRVSGLLLCIRRKEAASIQVRSNVPAH